jgi:hypothetical protein
MSSPEIKIICVSNVYTRLMFFKDAGDVEQGHYHTYNHASLLSSGSVLCEILDDNNSVVTSKIFKAPDLIFIAHDSKHKFTSLEPNTVLACIHALRNEADDILSPEFLVNTRVVNTPDLFTLNLLSQSVSGSPLQPLTVLDNN